MRRLYFAIIDHISDAHRLKRCLKLLIIMIPDVIDGVILYAVQNVHCIIVFTFILLQLSRGNVVPHIELS